MRSGSEKRRIQRQVHQSAIIIIIIFVVISVITLPLNVTAALFVSQQHVDWDGTCLTIAECRPVPRNGVSGQKVSFGGFRDEIKSPPAKYRRSCLRFNKILS